VLPNLPLIMIRSSSSRARSDNLGKIRSRLREITMLLLIATERTMISCSARYFSRKAI
jgi:hypothetical protein